jgi:iron complex outermembrane receptor protein
VGLRGNPNLFEAVAVGTGLRILAPENDRGVETMKYLNAILSTVAIPALVLGSQARAQDATAAGEDSGGIADIVVTAERREQSVQKSALTIQVLSGEDVIRSGLSAPADLSKVTTGVSVGIGGSNAQVFVRGVGSYGFTGLASPGVAFNIDGVNVGRLTGIGANFYDIARVEVLKGPQGTLYGRNANGGSINIVTNEPKLGEREMALNLEAGNYSSVRANGAVNLPLGQTAALRAAFSIVHRDGYLSDGTFDDVSQSARLRFKWEPSDTVSVLLNGDYSHIGGKGSNATWLPRRPGSKAYEGLSEPAANAYKLAFGPLGFFTKSLNDEAFQDINLYNISAQVDVDLDFAKLTVIPAYRKNDSKYLTNDIGGRYDDDGKTKQTSLEVRLGNSTAGLNWVVGGYYFRETQNEKLFVNNGDVPVPFLGNTVLQNIGSQYFLKTTAYAAFGQATLEVLPSFRIIAGARYTYEKASNDGFVNDVSVVPNVLRFGLTGARNFDGFSYKVGAEFDVGPQSMLYATYSTGFKAGGFSQASAPPLNTYDPEKLYAAEIGSKNRFLDNNLQVNVSGFYWKYKNLQDSRVNLDITGVPTFVTFNSGDAKIYGATLDVTATPTSRDTISFSGEYAHSKYDTFVFSVPAFLFLPGSNGCALSNAVIGGLPSVRQDCSGFQVARVPKWSGTVSYSHEFPLANGANVVAGVNAKYSSARWIGIDFIPSQRDGSYTVVDADLTYTSPSGNMTLGVFGRNITKSLYYTGGIQTAFNPGLFAANIGAPRTYGVRAGFNF